MWCYFVQLLKYILPHDGVLIASLIAGVTTSLVIKKAPPSVVYENYLTDAPGPIAT